MEKFLLILLVVGVVVYVISRLTGSNSEEAAAQGCMTSMGCGFGILQILIMLAMIFAAMAFIGWLFD